MTAYSRMLYCMYSTVTPLKTNKDLIKFLIENIDNVYQEDVVESLKRILANENEVAIQLKNAIDESHTLDVGLGESIKCR